MRSLHLSGYIYMSVCILKIWYVSTSGMYYQNYSIKELYLTDLKVSTYKSIISKYNINYLNLKDHMI